MNVSKIYSFVSFILFFLFYFFFSFYTFVYFLVLLFFFVSFCSRYVVYICLFYCYYFMHFPCVVFMQQPCNVVGFLVCFLILAICRSVFLYKYYKRPGRAYKVNRKRSRLAHEMTNGPTSQKALSVSGHTNHAGSFIYIHPNTTGDHTSAFQIPHSYHKILIVDIAHRS